MKKSKKKKKPTTKTKKPKNKNETKKVKGDSTCNTKEITVAQVERSLLDRNRVAGV